MSTDSIDKTPSWHDGPMRFRAVLELHGKTATGIEVPAEVVDALDAGQRPAVLVTVNGHTYRTTVARMGGQYLLPVSAQVRAASGASAGEGLDVDIELDTEPRTIDPPDDLAAELAADPALRAAWDGLSFTHRREHAEALTSAKKPETRQRRLAKTVEMLRGR